MTCLKHLLVRENSRTANVGGYLIMEALKNYLDLLI